MQQILALILTWLSMGY